MKKAMKNTVKYILIVIITTIFIISAFLFYAYKDATKKPNNAWTKLQEQAKERYKDGYPSLEIYHDTNAEYRDFMKNSLNSEFSFYIIKDNTIEVTFDMTHYGYTTESAIAQKEEIIASEETVKREIAKDANTKSGITPITIKYHLYCGDEYLYDTEETFNF